MKSRLIHMAVFSGTGNTLTVASVLAEKLRETGREVRIFPMDANPNFSLPPDAALGIATVVAAFSTYPTAWRFIDSLPPGEGREAFFLATMGGLGIGMEGPIRTVIEKKGYRPVGSKLFTMPGNYGNTTLDEAKNQAKVNKALAEVGKFAHDLDQGKASWQGGVPLVSNFFARITHGRVPWNLFNRAFPLAVNNDKCVGCGVCAELCPEDNIALEGGKASIGKNCQCCQRCIAFCPCEAIHEPGKPAERYRGVSIEAVRDLLMSKD